MKTSEYNGQFGSAAARLLRKRGAFFLLAIFTILHSRPVTAAPMFVAPEWKAHFRAKFVITNCVFEEANFSFGKTNLYHVRYQENAFLMRKIAGVEEAALDHIIGGGSYAGKFGNDYWAIEGGRVLKLFPNAEVMIREFSNPEVSLIDGPRRTLLGALFYGFHLLDPSSVEWLDDSTFRAASFRGDKYRGEIREAPGGLPTVIGWQAEADPGMQFTTECNYGGKFADLPYYPSKITLRATMKGMTVPVTEYRIVSLMTSPEPLPATLFDSARYFWAPTSSLPQTLVVTNDQVYIKDSRGSLQKVLSGPPPDLSGTTRNQRVTRAIVLGFVVLSVIPLVFAWRRAKKEKQKHNDQRK